MLSNQQVKSTQLKKCSACREELPQSNFYKNRSQPDGFQNVCKNCKPKYFNKIKHRSYSADWAANNKEKKDEQRRRWRKNSPEKEYHSPYRTNMRDPQYRFKYMYGVEYDIVLLKQNGVCAICHMPPLPGKPLHGDHNHACCSSRNKTCGKCFRGLLCRPCNFALGAMKDNPTNLRLAAEYLESNIKSEE